MREIRIPAFAKVNLRLDILGKRPDAYHELRTIFQTISLQDAWRRHLRIGSAVEIDLRKRIPAGRGLGAGSSDAGAAWRGSLRLPRGPLRAPKLMEIAASLGADVPFFLFGGRALGIGRGDEI